eukprot:CAMPEP_0172773476 /NCGR_PEP_ID=MMETSP1074-20121228/194364_1 /TAXON_ID=2916 /ORGANISM="Ceratium fusus, Strain PA161109" /LENGTH=54 /DNA_ID=CAMNT_0013609751 /DNA_START=642 /DNA_END=806 /DNA_ORIENTATION=+
MPDARAPSKPDVSARLPLLVPSQDAKASAFITASWLALEIAPCCSRHRGVCVQI